MILKIRILQSIFAVFSPSERVLKLHYCMHQVIDSTPGIYYMYKYISSSIFREKPWKKF